MNTIVRNDILDAISLGDSIMSEMIANEETNDLQKIAIAQQELINKFKVREVNYENRVFTLMNTQDGFTSVYEEIEDGKYIAHFSTKSNRWKQDKTFAKHVIKQEEELSKLAR